VRFVTWNVRRLCRSGSLIAAAKEKARYKLSLVDVQKIKWDKGSIVIVGDYIFSTEKEMKIIN
jgi:hypothetical protein